MKKVKKVKLANTKAVALQFVKGQATLDDLRNAIKQDRFYLEIPYHRLEIRWVIQDAMAKFQNVDENEVYYDSIDLVKSL